MSVFRDPAPEPATRLGRHRILSPTAAIRVSPLCLGAMNFGEAWKDFMGECTKETAFEMLDHFYASGGNFIDSANCYQNEESERWLGEWMAARGLRDQIVLATKYTTNLKTGQRASAHDQHSNFTGNSTKSLRLSLDASLRKLQTSYVDVLYVHWWSGDTSIEELMQSLNDVVRAGKALYLGVSDTPAWIVSKANQYARDHGLRQFCVYQGHWSAAARDLEKEILPMCQAEGMAVAPWGALGGGHFLSDEARRAKEKDKSGRQMGAATDKAIKVSKVLEEIANAKGTLITSVALAYVVHTSPDVYPIVGGRNKKHLQGNIEALTLRLTQQEMQRIEEASDFGWDFPNAFLYRGQHPANRNLRPENISLTGTAVHLDSVAPRAPILPPSASE